MITVRYLVEDVDSAVAFYTKHLGFEVKQQFGPAIAIMGRDDLTLWLAGPPASAARAMPDGRKPVPGGWNRFVLEVEDLPKQVESMRGQGAKFRNDIVEGPGGRQILLEDPSGNVIELFEPGRPRGVEIHTVAACLWRLLRVRPQASPFFLM
jgi:catechol 2,3-dioxygenase-like lactoylglutathione lyase family enzyme